MLHLEMYNKRIISLVLASAIGCSILSGCSSSIVGIDATSVKLQPALTQQEVLDYYAASMDYDTVVSRNIDVDLSNYETKVLSSDSNPDKYNAVVDALDKTTEMLKKNEYSASQNDRRYLPESMYHYIKAMLNDKELVFKEISNIESALGYYFVDVEYEIKPAQIGKFNSLVDLVGMNGAIKYTQTNDRYHIDDAYLINAANKLNDYYTTNHIDQQVSYDKNTYTLNFSYADNSGSKEVVDVNNSSSPSDGSTPVASTPDVGETPTAKTSNLSGTYDRASAKYYNPRQTSFDLRLFNRVAGYGGYSSFVPDLDLIYEKPSETGNISGIGLYPSGDLGLKIFGVNRSELTGTCTLRFLYKEDLVNPDILSCENIYVSNYNITSGFNSNEDNLVPGFLEAEFATLIERADRAMINEDITGLMSGGIFSDIGMGVLTGYTGNYGNVLRQISTLRRIIQRDIESNAYLVEIESYRNEGSEYSDLYASYKDIIYAVIEQQGSEFVITDWMPMSRTLVTEPDINPDAATSKRIVSLGLTGEVSDVSKEAVNKLLGDLYLAGSKRVLTGPFTIGDTVIEKGMYDCFNSNVEMLSTARRSKINTDLCNMLVRFGTATTSTLSGKVTEWIGGASNQVEFTTEECITYQGRNEGIYMTCYYLVSCIEDEWVIDDIQILTKEELSGDGFKAVVDRIVGQ